MQVAQHGNAQVAVDCCQRVHHHLGVARVERGNRLVGQNDFGLLHQGAANGHALLLPARQLVAALGGKVGHAKAVQRLQGGQLVGVAPQREQRAPGRHAGQAAHQHVGKHVQAPDQVELLKHHGAVAPPLAQVLALQIGDHRAFKLNRARRRFIEAVDHAQQRGLARTRATNDADKAARRHRQRHAVYRVGIAKALAEIAKVKCVHGRSWRCACCPAGSGWRELRQHVCQRGDSS